MNFSRENKNNSQLTIFLYNDPSSKTLNLKKIRSYLKHKLADINVIERKDFINFHLDLKEQDEFAKELAKSKVRDLSNSKIDFEPLYGEVRYENQLIECPEKNLTGVLYNGYRLDTIFQSLIPKEELDFNYLHIMFTNRLFGTFDENDKRYHARVIICGYPSIISTSGIVEAPAKPKEFYHIKQKYSMLGTEMPLEVIKEKFQGRFIDYDDPRLTEVMKGYIMQSVFYHFTHEPFCEEKNCRLYNAHWQEEVINAQLNGSEFCEKHEKILKNMNEGMIEVE